MNTIDNIVRQTIEGLCLEFAEQPYVCYTEHGLHALFFSRLYDALREDQRYFEWNGRRVCAIQKEYATAHDLGKSKRQHWDIAVLRNPPATRGEHPYDFFKIDAAVEFGLNEGKEHLLDDMRRLSHTSSNVGTGYAVHLYRISEGLSERDMSPRSARMWPGRIRLAGRVCMGRCWSRRRTIRTSIGSRMRMCGCSMGWWGIPD